MSRRTVRCTEKHTPLNPGKDRVRRNWIKKLRPGSTVITISHGALGVLDILQHCGPIQVCDIDPGVIESTRYMRETDYPELNILPPLNWTVQDTVLEHLEDHGVKGLKGGAIDLDLADCIETCWPIVEQVLRALIIYKCHTKVLFTFRNGRDCFGRDSLSLRLKWLKQRLPKGVKYVSHEAYYSGRTNEDASRKQGSPMCIVELST